MAQFLGFGNGSDGAATLSGTDAPIDASCSGTAAATSLAATNASFAANQLILIHQSRGTGAGAWEINQIASYVAGTITTTLPLTNTYTDSGASQAQVLVLKQYSSVTISGTLTAKAWDGNVGGIVTFLCCGKVTISGTLTVKGKGFRGATSSNNGNGYAGEGTVGPEVDTHPTANGTGGGGATERTDGAPGGGGAGHTNAGTKGQDVADQVGGNGGSTGGSSDLITMIFGGGGGKGGNNGPSAGNGGNGGNGGGIVMIFAYQREITGTINLDGNNGSNASSTNCGGGGAGAAGSCLNKIGTDILGTNLITALGGTGGSPTGSGGSGGASSVGRIRLESCSRTGTTNPSASESIGGQSYCSTGGGIL